MAISQGALHPNHHIKTMQGCFPLSFCLGAQTVTSGTLFHTDFCYFIKLGSRFINSHVLRLWKVLCLHFLPFIQQWSLDRREREGPPSCSCCPEAACLRAHWISVEKKAKILCLGASLCSALQQGGVVEVHLTSSAQRSSLHGLTKAFPLEAASP